MIRIAVVQFTPALGDKPWNLQALRRIIERSEADLIVLPELCTTGYFFTSKHELAPLAEVPDGEASRMFGALATSKRSIIVAGIAERSGASYFNSVFVFRPGEPEPLVYRKSHLFYKESMVFEPGDTGFPVFRDERLDVTVGVMLCYDWRFPEAARCLALEGADVIVCPSNLVTDAWRKVMPARAIENKLFVAVANRAGTEDRDGEVLEFKGHSALYDPWGEALLQAGPSGDDVLVAEIDPSRSRDKRFNDRNDIFLDRRPELYARLLRM
ncbi:MAG: carbon-nitrogen hydrolase [Chlorobiaceae bacterium]|nr:carbon-nitrogen hydrolase [Chlorobiaceae bacterium]